MTNKMMNMIADFFPVEERNAGEFQNMKVSLFNFSVHSFEAKGLGNVSVMTGKALFGLMKMDTVVVNPFDKDAPLFSYDRIYAMGNDTAFLELFDTRLNRVQFTDRFEKLMEDYKDFPERPASANWYDDIILCAFCKKSKKSDSPKFDTMVKRFLEEYLDLCKISEGCDRKEKIKASRKYTEGLLSEGGPSTNQFIKAKGKEFTGKLFREYLFGTGNPEE